MVDFFKAAVLVQWKYNSVDEKLIKEVRLLKTAAQIHVPQKEVYSQFLLTIL